MIRALGHLGLWAGLYALAALICFAHLAGLTLKGLPLPRWEAMVCVLLTATAVYALDRVKVRRHLLDPADAAAQPGRYEFLHRVDRTARVIASLLLLSAGAIGFRLGWYIPLAVLFSGIAGVIYAPGPRRHRARLKDRLYIKNAYAALGMTGFVGLVGLAAESGPRLADLSSDVRARGLTLVLAGAVVAWRIFLDAALCDIDDEQTDRHYRTDTFAVTLGPARVWTWSGLGRLGIALALPILTPLAMPARMAWCIAMLLGMAALRWRRPERIRDTIDVRFLPEAIFVSMILLVLGVLLKWMAP